VDKLPAMLNEAPDARTFRRSPMRLRPHALLQNPVTGDVAEALRWFRDCVVPKGQNGMTFCPKWERWDDPTLFTDIDDYWPRVRTTAEVVRQQGGYAWVYDEPGFPSGTAGMRTLQGHPELQASGVSCLWCDARDGERASVTLPEGQLVRACAVRLDSGHLVADSVVEVTADEQTRSVTFDAADGVWRLMAFVRELLYEGTSTYGTREHYISRPGYVPKGDWRSNEYAYPNLMDARATRRFIEVAYEPYAKHAGDYLGGIIRAFFTDEPTVPQQGYRCAASVPWCDGFSERFRERFGYDIVEKLPALFFETGGAECGVRCDFYDLVADLFATNFVRRMTEWCTRHDVAFTGHFLGEEYLVFHIMNMGSLIRGAREMSMPGIDHLGSGFVGRSLMPAPVPNVTSTTGAITPKLISSAAHLGGWTRTMSESHGFCNRWAGTSFSDYVAVANWQMVLGINKLAYCMNPDWIDWIGATDVQRRRYSEYAGRLAYMTAGGVHRAELAVVYPIASAWARFSPVDVDLYDADPEKPRWADGEIGRIQSVLDDVVRELLARQVDFDFVEERDIASAELSGDRLNIGAESFGAVLLPSADVLTVATMKKLDDLRCAGGRIFVAGNAPERAPHSSDTDTVARVASEWSASGDVVFSEDPERAAAAVAAGIRKCVVLDPTRPDIYVLHQSKAGDDVYFLVNNGTTDYAGRVTFSAAGAPQLWNAWTGRAYALEHKIVPQGTTVELSLAGRTGCFVVFGADASGVVPADESMWEFGPPATAIEDYAAWLEKASIRFYFGDGACEIGSDRQLQWRGLAPADGVSVAEIGGALTIEVAPWRRLGWVVEGLVAEPTLQPGVYQLEFETRADNIELWNVQPRYFADDGAELYDSGIDMFHIRHSLDAPGPHDWLRWRWCFCVPKGAARMQILLLPMDKGLFSRRATLALRNAVIRPITGEVVPRPRYMTHPEW